MRTSQPLCERLPLTPLPTVTDDTPLASHASRPEGSAVVELRGIKKSYGSKEVLHGVDLTVHAGEHVVIFGPSGSGKSTLLRTINLLEEPSEGSVRVLGVEYGPGLRRATRSAAARSSCAGTSAWSSSSSISSRT